MQMELVVLLMNDSFIKGSTYTQASHKILGFGFIDSILLKIFLKKFPMRRHQLDDFLFPPYFKVVSSSSQGSVDMACMWIGSFLH